MKGTMVSIVDLSSVVTRTSAYPTVFLGVNTWYVAEGAQGVVHGCETLDPESTLKNVAIKVYKDPQYVSSLIN